MKVIGTFGGNVWGAPAEQSRAITLVQPSVFNRTPSGRGVTSSNPHTTPPNDNTVPATTTPNCMSALNTPPSSRIGKCVSGATTARANVEKSPCDIVRTRATLMAARTMFELLHRSTFIDAWPTLSPTPGADTHANTLLPAFVSPVNATLQS